LPYNDRGADALRRPLRRRVEPPMLPPEATGGIEDAG